MQLIKLASEINQQGDEFIRKNGAREFHLFAADILNQYPVHKHYNFEELASFTFLNGTTEIQNFRSLEFSELPVTISRGEFSFIDLYFWRRRPTVIHNHHFSGAFMGLLGKNMDLEFDFTANQEMGKHHEYGVLNLRREKTVSPGDIVPIAPLDGFIHQNHHQAELTVNLCFRTPEIPGKNLSNYLYTGLKFTKDPELLCRVANLRRLIDLGQFDITSLNLNLDDAIAFLVQNHGSKSGNPLFAQVRDFCHAKVHSETGLHISELINGHDEKCDALMESYE